MGQPPCLCRPVAPTRPLEASILPDSTEDVAIVPLYVYPSLPSLLLHERMRTIVSFATLISYIDHKIQGTPSIRADAKSRYCRGSGRKEFSMT